MRAITAKQVQYIQTLRRQAGIDDATWQAMKESVGVRSTLDLDQGRFNELLDRLGAYQAQFGGRRAAYRPVHKSAKKSGMDKRPPQDTAAMLGKIEAILAEYRLPWSYADAIATRQFGVERLRFCTPEQTYKVLQALTVYQRRQKRK